MELEGGDILCPFTGDWSKAHVLLAVVPINNAQDHVTPSLGKHGGFQTDFFVLLADIADRDDLIGNPQEEAATHIPSVGGDSPADGNIAQGSAAALLMCHVHRQPRQKRS